VSVPSMDTAHTTRIALNRVGNVIILQGCILILRLLLLLPLPRVAEWYETHNERSYVLG
jgi:hypothetical protein